MDLHIRGKVQYPTAKQTWMLYGIDCCPAHKRTLGAAAAECRTKKRLSFFLSHADRCFRNGKRYAVMEKRLSGLKDCGEKKNE